MFVIVLAGAIMAISFSAPPGPVTVETIRRGLRGGFGPALSVQLGSIIGDVAWCAIALLGLAPLVQIAWLRGLLSVAGVGVMIYLGGASIRDGLRMSPGPTLAPHQGKGFRKQKLKTEFSTSVFGEPSYAARQSKLEPLRDGAFRSGLAISIANPMAVGYWLSVGAALIASGGAGRTGAQTASFLAGFVGATLAWAFLMAAAVHWGKQILTPPNFRFVTFVCGAALVLFGVTLAFRMLGWVV